jgi:hypothetical protein
MVLQLMLISGDRLRALANPVILLFFEWYLRVKAKFFKGSRPFESSRG